MQQVIASLKGIFCAEGFFFSIKKRFAPQHHKSHVQNAFGFCKEKAHETIPLMSPAHFAAFFSSISLETVAFRGTNDARSWKLI
jgi:hypothetical protein